MKTSKINGVVWVKKDKLTACSEQRLQQINAGREDYHPSKRPFKVERMDEEQKFKTGIRISRYKPSGLRDLSWDRAIKEPYWRPLAFVHDMQIRIRSIKV